MGRRRWTHLLLRLVLLLLSGLPLQLLVLLPVFAIGRAQELLLLLDDYWTKNPDLQAPPRHAHPPRDAPP